MMSQETCSRTTTPPHVLALLWSGLLLQGRALVCISLHLWKHWHRLFHGCPSCPTQGQNHLLKAGQSAPSAKGYYPPKSLP